MHLLTVCLALGLSLSLVLGREEVHHIHSEKGRNVHIHLHEVGTCDEKVEHHHHHDNHSPEPADVVSKPGKKKKGKKGKKNKMMADEAVDAVTPEHPHHEGDDDIHIHIHEAGENCTNHDHHGNDDEHHGEHHGQHHGGHHRGHGGHACAMCARALGHHREEHDDHKRDHPAHHGPHKHGEDADKHKHSEDYVYAHCAMKPNIAVPKKKRHKIGGVVHMRQLIYGGPVEMKIDLEGFLPRKQRTHALHVHEFGDLTGGCSSTGSHFNPFGMAHGAPTDEIRHAGDFGNIECDDDGKVIVEKNDTGCTLVGHHNIIGRGLVIHEGEDDLGKGGTPASVRSGNAGQLIACCDIVRAAPHDMWESDVHDHSGDHHHDSHDDHGDHKDHNHAGHMHHGHGKMRGKHMHHGKKDMPAENDPAHDHSKHGDHHGHHDGDLGGHDHQGGHGHH